MKNNGTKGNLFSLVVFMLVFMLSMGTFTFYSLNNTFKQGQNNVANVNKLKLYVLIIIFISMCLIILLALIISEIQRRHYSKLTESNQRLKKEIKDRLLAEDKMHHFAYYDELTDLYNRKNC